MSAYADDNFTFFWDRDKSKLIRDMEKELETLTKWLKDLGLKVNDMKTELILFYKKDCQPITISLNQNIIKSAKTIKVLGVTFDSKLQWSTHISYTIARANSALHAIRIIG